MESFEGKLAVVTGGGSGMGRSLVVQLAHAGCSVATCDIMEDALQETKRLALQGAPEDVVVSTHLCDVSHEPDVLAFRDEVIEAHGTDHLELVFNNAGIAGGGSFITEPREQWERTFGVDFYGVYYCTRAFLPLLMAADRGVLVNTSSINGFHASLGPGVPHTAYSTAKFAVKGFSEALIEDLRVNAPHVSVAVVMPGHIGTDIVNNTQRIHGFDSSDDAGSPQVWRALLANLGVDADQLDEDELAQAIAMVGDGFRDTAPTTADEAATIILDGVRAGRWRILVGDDAHALDERVRSAPEIAYEYGPDATIANPGTTA